MQGVLHTILAGANIGILVLATGAFFLRLALGRSDTTLAQRADIIAFSAAVVGFSLAILSGLSGYFLTWPREAIQSTLLTQNKTLVTVALLGSWGMFAYLRWRVGPDLWKSVPLKVWSTLLVLSGFVNTVLVGSMGGSASLKGTALDPALLALNLNRYVSLSWAIWVNVLLIVLSVAVVGYTVLRRRKA
jgi:hypothetical protein